MSLSMKEREVSIILTFITFLCNTIILLNAFLSHLFIEQPNVERITASVSAYSIPITKSNSQLSNHRPSTIISSSSNLSMLFTYLYEFYMYNYVFRLTARSIEKNFEFIKLLII